jgi:hypothetical protein
VRVVQSAIHNFCALGIGVFGAYKGVNMEQVICDCCGSHSPQIHEFSEFSHIVPCVEKDSNGATKGSWKPVFTKSRELCFSCYRSAVRKYVAETRAKT